MNGTFVLDLDQNVFYGWFAKSEVAQAVADQLVPEGNDYVLYDGSDLMKLGHGQLLDLWNSIQGEDWPARRTRFKSKELAEQELRKRGQDICTLANRDADNDDAPLSYTPPVFRRVSPKTGEEFPGTVIITLEDSLKEIVMATKKSTRKKTTSKRKGNSGKTGGKPRNGNCARIWAICDKLANSGKEFARKDVLSAAEKEGIPQATASTQYQLWRHAS